MTHKLEAEWTGDRVTLLGRWMIELLNFKNYWWKPTIRNSVLDGLREIKLYYISIDGVPIAISCALAIGIGDKII